MASMLDAFERPDSLALKLSQEAALEAWFLENPQQSDRWLEAADELEVRLDTAREDWETEWLAWQLLRSAAVRLSDHFPIVAESHDINLARRGLLRSISHPRPRVLIRHTRARPETRPPEGVPNPGAAVAGFGACQLRVVGRGVS